MTIFMHSKLCMNLYKKELGHKPVQIRVEGTMNDYGFYRLGNTDMNHNSGVGITSKVMTDERNSTADLSIFMRGAGQAYILPERNNIYSLDGSSHYTFKVMPSIDSISYNEGYATGGQVLTITGSALDGTNVSIVVDGLVCDVLTVDKEELTCRTRAKPMPEPEEQPEETPDGEADDTPTDDTDAPADDANPPADDAAGDADAPADDTPAGNGGRRL